LFQLKPLYKTALFLLLAGLVACSGTNPSAAATPSPQASPQAKDAPDADRSKVSDDDFKEIDTAPLMKRVAVIEKVVRRTPGQVKLTQKVLADAVEADKVATFKKYDNHVVVFTGKADRVTKHRVTDTPQIRVKLSVFEKVIVDFTATHAAKVSALKAGDEFKIRCWFSVSWREAQPDRSSAYLEGCYFP
jgi:hypothetical protein